MGGKMLAQKGVGVQEEIENAAEAIELLGGSAPELEQIILPNRDQPHYLVVVSKLGETPAKYPRRVGMPSKRPL
jgi:16S rRNA (guanine527-N7)-methyltransferase